MLKSNGQYAKVSRSKSICIYYESSTLRYLSRTSRWYPTLHSPSFKLNREVIRRTISYVRGALDPNPDVLLHGARLAGEVKSKKIQITLPRQIRQHHFPAQAAVLLTSEESSDDTTKQRSP